MSGFDTVGSVATESYNYLDSPSTGVSGALVSFASGATIELGNLVNQGVSAPIAEKYQSVLIKMTAVKALTRQMNVGADSGFTLGDLSVNAPGAQSSESAQIQILKEEINQELKSLGRKMTYYRTY